MRPGFKAKDKSLSETLPRNQKERNMEFQGLVENSVIYRTGVITRKPAKFCHESLNIRVPEDLKGKQRI